MVVLNILVLLIGSFILSVLFGTIAGNKDLSFAFLNILLVVVIGGVLTIWHGWVSTGIVLGVNAVICVLSGHFDRSRR